MSTVVSDHAHMLRGQRVLTSRLGAEHNEAGWRTDLMTSVALLPVTSNVRYAFSSARMYRPSSPRGTPDSNRAAFAFCRAARTAAQMEGCTRTRSIPRDATVTMLEKQYQMKVAGPINSTSRRAPRRKLKTSVVHSRVPCRYLLGLASASTLAGVECEAHLSEQGSGPAGSQTALRRRPIASPLPPISMYW